MANDTLITIVGNLTADPELRFTGGGDAVVNFTVASTPRSFDKQTNSWKDGETLFLRCSAWRDYAENIADSLSKGTRVIVQGKLVQRSYEREGQQRTSYEIQVEEVGPSLRYAKAQVERTPRDGQNSTGRAAGRANSGGVDTWTSQGASGPQNGAQGDPWGTNSDQASLYPEKPPF